MPAPISQRFDRLVVHYELPPSKTGNRSRRVACLCDCGNVTSPRLSVLVSGGVKSCGCFRADQIRECFGDKSPSWRGGRRKDVNGYILLQDRYHPRADKNGSVSEHSVIMEAKIGRALRSREFVHHMNGVRDDNRPENLELWDKSHPPGQRHEDKMRFYTREILEKASPVELSDIFDQIANKLNGNVSAAPLTIPNPPPPKKE